MQQSAVAWVKDLWVWLQPDGGAEVTCQALVGLKSDPHGAYSQTLSQWG